MCGCRKGEGGTKTRRSMLMIDCCLRIGGGSGKDCTAAFAGSLSQHLGTTLRSYRACNIAISLQCKTALLLGRLYSNACVKKPVSNMEMIAMPRAFRTGTTTPMEHVWPSLHPCPEQVISTDSYWEDRRDTDNTVIRGLPRCME